MKVRRSSEHGCNTATLRMYIYEKSGAPNPPMSTPLWAQALPSIYQIDLYDLNYIYMTQCISVYSNGSVVLYSNWNIYLYTE